MPERSRWRRQSGQRRGGLSARPTEELVCPRTWVAMRSCGGRWNSEEATARGPVLIVQDGQTNGAGTHGGFESRRIPGTNGLYATSSVALIGSAWREALEQSAEDSVPEGRSRGMRRHRAKPSTAERPGGDTAALLLLAPGSPSARQWQRRPASTRFVCAITARGSACRSADCWRRQPGVIPDHAFVPSARAPGASRSGTAGPARRSGDRRTRSRPARPQDRARLARRYGAPAG